MSAGLQEALARWRAVALAIVTDAANSTPSQREIAWRFLRAHGAK